VITDITNPKYKKALFKFEQKCLGATVDYALVYKEDLEDWDIVPLEEAVEKNLSITMVCLCHKTLEERRKDEKKN
jgi:hypothetical protein